MYHIPYHGDKDLSQIRFLVIGGAGFIGSNIVNYLLKFGAGKVRVFDNFSTGSISNLESFSYFPSFELMKGDIRDLTQCKKAVEDIDVILNEVALDPEFNSSDASRSKKGIQINGFLNILIASKYAGVKRIIFSSFSTASAEIAGLNDPKDLITPSLSPYSISKYVNELYASVFCRLYDLDYIGLRYFNVFGPGQNDDDTQVSIIPKLVNSHISGKSTLIMEETDKAIDLNYIENIVQANILAALTIEPAALNQNYNVACGELITISEMTIFLMQKLGITTPLSAKLKFRQPIREKAEIPCSYISITKAMSLLNYQPCYSIKEGLEETLKISKTEYGTIISD
jgi:UDP-N-acetylglucosamine 4-epimerase